MNRKKPSSVAVTVLELKKRIRVIKSAFRIPAKDDPRFISDLEHVTAVSNLDIACNLLRERRPIDAVHHLLLVQHKQETRPAGKTQAVRVRAAQGAFKRWRREATTIDHRNLLLDKDALYSVAMYATRTSTEDAIQLALIAAAYKHGPVHGPSKVPPAT